MRNRLHSRCRPLVNEKKMSSPGRVSTSPRSGDRQFMESEERYAAHTPVTLYASLSLDDTARPTGLMMTDHYLLVLTILGHCINFRIQYYA